MFGLPSIIAVIMNYLKRGEARARHLAGAALQLATTHVLDFSGDTSVPCCCSGLVFVLVGVPLLIAAWVAIGVWATYRIARGWLGARDGRALPTAGV